MQAERGVGEFADAEIAMKEASARALRFPLELPLRYRSAGDTRWREARTENISRSGVLFRTDDLVDIDTEVEMIVVLPVRPTPSAVLCRGRIVRTVLPAGVERHPGLAATISSYRFQRARNAA